MGLIINPSLREPINTSAVAASTKFRTATPSRDWHRLLLPRTLVDGRARRVNEDIKFGARMHARCDAVSGAPDFRGLRRGRLRPGGLLAQRHVRRGFVFSI